MFGTSANAFVSPQRFQDSHSLGFMKVRVKSLVYETYYSCLCQVAALARCRMNGSIHFDRTTQKKKKQKQRP